RALSQMIGIALQLEKLYPETNSKMGVRLDPYHSTLVAQKQPALWMLLAAVTALFLIVCSNVANLQLGRAAARVREIGIRQALGAPRGRLVRQLLTESLVLAIAGGALGLALSAAAGVALLHYAPASIPGFADLRIDSQVVFFNAAITLCAPLLFGVIPALTSSRPEGLRARGIASPRAGRATRDLLAAVEVALSVVLVAGSGLLIRSLIQLDNVEPGFNPQHAVSFTVLLPQARYPKDEQCVQTFQAIASRLRGLPGVQSAGASTTLALGGYTWTNDATPEGRGKTPDDYEREMRNAVITPGYFRAMGTPLLRGRDINEFDTAKSLPVTVVNQALEKVYFPGQNAIGKRIKRGRPGDSEKTSPWVTVVGVVADYKQDGMDARVLPEGYFPETQEVFNQLSFVVRGDAGVDGIIKAAQEQIHKIDRELVLTDVKPLRDILSESTGDQRFRTSLLSAFAALALFLATLGVYGVLAYSVAQRVREIGVRLALGASRGRLFGMVVRDGMRPVILGLILGLCGVTFLTRWIQSLLFGVTPSDPATFLLTVAVLTAAASCACGIPALRAIRVDPAISLREM
ncbi:MAG TPA: FtsX-like permease family protein, partial [Bryobacteraceae bacterium]|nr:FtsX-like permease family protein [Bryobacteraceae bacterium]